MADLEALVRDAKEQFATGMRPCRFQFYVPSYNDDPPQCCGLIAAYLRNNGMSASSYGDMICWCRQKYRLSLGETNAFIHGFDEGYVPTMTTQHMGPEEKVAYEAGRHLFLSVEQETRDE